MPGRNESNFRRVSFIQYFLSYSIQTKTKTIISVPKHMRYFYSNHENPYSNILLLFLNKEQNGGMC